MNYHYCVIINVMLFCFTIIHLPLTNYYYFVTVFSLGIIFRLTFFFFVFTVKYLKNVDLILLTQKDY